MKLTEIKQISPNLKTKQWLDKMRITDYTIRPDGIVDVDGGVNLHPFGDVYVDGLRQVKGTTIPVQFGKVTGDFSCSTANITSLAGCPQSVGGNFYCNDTKITSLAGCPQSVGGHFACDDTAITSLVGGPQSVGGNFYCHDTKITSLVGCPQSIGGYFYCHDTNILNLLRFFAIKHMRSVNTGIAGIDDIINKYLVGDRQINMIYAQDELIDAGFGKQAKW